ncbi:MAG: lysine--tRNA ligase, partial [Planctomycetota bacterium]
LLGEWDFLEVETPMMQPVYGGAAARPFVTHHNTLDVDLYLRISPELYLKRLLVGGLERVYEINRNFRNEGISTQHNPEFTMMELYQAYADYNDMMELTERLVAEAALEVCGSMTLPFGDAELDYTPPWPRRTYAELVREHAGVDMFDDAAVRARAREFEIEESNKDWAVVVNDLFEAMVEDRLIQPTFVTHQPAELAPLCRRSPDDPRLSERFEVLVAGFELANAYTELNDPAAQRQALTEQLERRDEGTVGRLDEDFLLAMEHGMPPAGGLGVGIDRLLMILLEKPSLRDVILFPLMRPETAE